MKNLSAHLIVVDRRGRLLLTKRNDVPIWVIPGGHIENGESPSETVQREFFEETSLRSSKPQLVAQYFSADGKIRKYLFFGKTRKFKSKTNTEVREINWFEPKNLPSPMTVYEKRKVQDWSNFRGKIIQRLDRIDRNEEIVNQLKAPLTFCALVAFFIKNKLFGSKSFKV